MVRTQVKITGVESTVFRLGVANRKVGDNLAAVLDETTKNIRDNATRLAPLKTGTYRKTIKKQVDKISLSAKAGPMVRGRPNPLGHLIEGGVKPHSIPNAYGSGKTVRHPGTKPRHHLDPAWEHEEPKYIRAVQRAIEEGIK